MDNKIWFILIISVLFISGCFQQQNQIEHFSYTKDNQTYTSVNYTDMSPTIKWIRENTPEDAIFLNWWDYGHMIRGQAGRETIVYGPSREILHTVSKYATLPEEELAEIECDCNPHEKIQDVANALITEDPDETIEFMNKYGADYVLVRKNDGDKSFAISIAAGKKSGDNANTIFLRMINGEEIEGFKQVYLDETIRIYKLK